MVGFGTGVEAIAGFRAGVSTGSGDVPGFTEAISGTRFAL